MPGVLGLRGHFWAGSGSACSACSSWTGSRRAVESGIASTGTVASTASAPGARSGVRPPSAPSADSP
ncbi:hypothetical protein NKH77_49040 [Streptomyces sp. M19]